MEFNAVHQYRPATEPFPLLDQHSHDATALIYSCGSYPAHTQTSQSIGASPVQNWALGNTTQAAPPLQRHSTMFVGSRPPMAEVQIPRPLSMTAVQTFRGIQGLQNPQGEYLPQPKMPPPIVQPPAMTQATIAHPDWTQPKLCGDFEYPSVEHDISDYSHGMLSADDDTTIIDLRQYTNFGADHAHDMFLDPSRRMSESSYSMSSNGPLADVPSFDDLSASDTQGQHDDWTGYDNHSKAHLDSSSSPHAPQRDSLVRSNSRSRASPVPNLRASPYTLESTRNKRWSTGMYPGATTPRPYQFNRYSSYYGSPLNPQSAFSSFAPETMSSLQQPNFLYPPNQFNGNNGMLFSSSDQYPEAPRPLPSQGLFRLLQSNADRLTGCSSHFADLSDPPDLYSSLHEEGSSPPEEDMNPSDPDLVPHEQELRFPGDLYTPRWVRGHGNKREGWCGLCKPGRWLVLKNSAFWYDKSFTHGVSAATGAAFQGPQETRRTEGNLDVWEGLCGSCGDWIALVSSKKKGTTWFRHAYKCHTHPKVKDGPKRRREIALNPPRPAGPTTVPAVPTSTDIPLTSTVIEPSPLESQSPAKDDKVDVKLSHNNLEVKAEDDATPVSTPQLTHTTLSTPQMTHMQTPSYQPTTRERKRHSMMFDHSTFSQGFSTHLETFAEHEMEPSPSTHTTALSHQLPSDEPTFTFNHDGTFTAQADSFNITDHHQLLSDPSTDHYMSHSHDTSPNNFFSHHASDHHFDMSSHDYKITNGSLDSAFPDMI